MNRGRASDYPDGAGLLGAEAIGERPLLESVGAVRAPVDASITHWEGLPFGQTARIIEPRGDTREPHGDAIARALWSG